jgi:uncharacterized protein YbcV (DUF1398 family)
MHECATGSHAGTLNFPTVVQKLAQVGVAQYHADFMRSETTYYLPNGESHSEPLTIPTLPIAQDFSGDNVASAVKAAQGGLPYKEFLVHVFEAGCTGYFVYIEGQRVVYFGRKGDMHIEYFPGSRL